MNLSTVKWAQWDKTQPNILCDFPIMINKDTCCDDRVVTCSDIVVITAYNVYVYFFSQVSFKFSFLFFAYLLPVLYSGE